MTRRGAILLEMLVAMAIFVGVGTLTLSIVSNSLSSVERAHESLLAMDLARSKLAELEAGLINVFDLSASTIESIGSVDLLDLDGLPPENWTWRCEVDTQITEFDGLTLVEVRIYENDDAVDPSATLRRLVRLREEAVDEYEQDELLEGLPEGGGE